MNKRQKSRILKWSIMLILTIFYISASDDANILKRVHAYSSEIYTSGDWEYQLNENGQAIITLYKGTEKELTIHQIDGKDVIAIGEYAFLTNQEIERVTLGEGIQSIEENAFFNCGNLQQINFPDSLTFIDEYAFEACFSLKEVTFPKNLQNIDGKIFGFYRPDRIDISEENPFLVKKNGIIYNSDFSCVLYSSKEELSENIILPETVSKIGNYAFANCNQITDISLPKGLKSIDASAFDGCINIEKMQLPEGIESLGEHAFKGLYIEEIIIPKSVIEVGTGVFYGANIKRATIQAPLTDLNEMFTFCCALEEVNLPSTLKILNCFYCCESLKKVTIPESVEIIESHAFFQTGLIELTIPAGVTEIQEGAIANNQNLLKIEVAEENEKYDTQSGMLIDTNGVLLATTMNQTGEITIPSCCNRIGNDVFLYRTDITKVVIPDGVVEIGAKAFFSCTQLSEISIPSGITKIEAYAFRETMYYDCEMNWENGVCYLDNYALEIGEGEYVYIKEGCTLLADMLCSNNDFLKKIVLPCSLQYIGDYAFQHCNNLQEVLGGGNIKEIRNYAFVSNRSLEKVYLGGESIFLGNYAFDGCASMKELVIDARWLEFQESSVEGCYQNEKLVLTNMDSRVRLFDTQEDIILLYPDSEDLQENGDDYFYGVVNQEIYLNISSKDFEDKDYEWLKNNKVYFQNEFFVYRYFIDGKYAGFEIVKSGEAVIPPFTFEEEDTLLWNGSVYCNVSWDIDNDGIGEPLPEYAFNDIEAHALYWTPEESSEPLATTTVTPKKSPEPSAMATVTPEESPEPSATATVTPEESPEPSAMATVTPKKSPEPSATTTVTPEESPEPSAMATVTPKKSPEPSATTTVTPEKSPESTVMETLPPLAQVTLPPRISSIKVTETKKCYVKVSWNKVDEAQMYYIYRSEKKKKDYTFLKSVSLNKSSYTDKTAISGKTYYYKVIPWGVGDIDVLLDMAIRKKIKVHYLSQPMIRVRKAQTSTGQKYVEISLKQYQGEFAEIYYKTKEEVKFHRLPIEKKKISKYRQKFKLRYKNGGVTLCFKVRTYMVKKGTKRYSRYSKVVKKKI